MNKMINIVFLGDIVGRPGRRIVTEYLSDISSETIDVNTDFIIANVENASHGFGLTEKNYKELSALGIDCFTSGNHIWDKKDIYSYIETAEKLVRPLNYPDSVPGVGAKIFEKSNIKIGVINILGKVFMDVAISPWTIIQSTIEKLKVETPIIFIDFHAEATAEKICFAKHCSDLGVSAVVGTHTHVQTADEKIINNHTAYITDVGFCGAADGIIGMRYEDSLKRLSTGLPERFEIADGDTAELNAVVTTIDVENGSAHSIKRIQYKKTYDEVKLL